MKGLQEEISRLSSIRDANKAIEWLFSERLQLQELKPPTVAEGQAEPVPVRVASRNSHDGKVWKLAPGRWLLLLLKTCTYRISSLPS